MPRVLGYENRSTSFARATHIVECDRATALQNVEGFVFVEVSVNRNARALGQLLRAQSKIIGPRYGVDLDEDIAAITKMDQVFTLSGTKHIALRHRFVRLLAVWHLACSIG